MGSIGQRAVMVMLLLVAGAASSADLAVQVVDKQGRPVADAVVTLLAPGLPKERPAARTRAVDQAHLTFDPYVEVFRPGDAVVFRNSDTTRHHVYSFSPVKAFEFVLLPGTRSGTLQLDRPGVVAVGCNIHDGMISYLYVSDAPWLARTDARGRAEFNGLRAGRHDVRVWHPRLPPRRPELAQAVVLRVGETRTLTFPVTLRPDPRRQSDRERTRY